MKISKSKQHGLIAKFFHWGFIILFIYAILKGLDDVDQLADQAFLYFEITFATLFLFVLAIRFIYMKRTQPTALPDNTPSWKKKAARFGHLAMYFSIASIALTGLFIGGIYWIGIPSGPIMNISIALHEFSIIASFLAIGLHISAAIYHRFLGDGIWSSMVPIFKEKG